MMIEGELTLDDEHAMKYTDDVKGRFYITFNYYLTFDLLTRFILE